MQKGKNNETMKISKVGEITLSIFALLALIYITTCIAGNVWINVTIKTIDSDVIKGYDGLWKICRHGRCYTRSSDFEESWYTTTRAFAVMGCLANFAALVSTLLGVFLEKLESFVTSILFILAAVLMIISLATFVRNADLSTGRELGWSYIVGWVGVGISLIGAVFGILMKKCDSDD